MLIVLKWVWTVGVSTSQLCMINWTWQLLSGESHALPSRPSSPALPGTKCKRYRIFLALKSYLESHQVYHHPFCRDSSVEILDVVSYTAHCKQQSSCHWFSQDRIRVRTWAASYTLGVYWLMEYIFVKQRMSECEVGLFKILADIIRVIFKFHMKFCLEVSERMWHAGRSQKNTNCSAPWWEDLERWQ